MSNAHAAGRRPIPDVRTPAVAASRGGGAGSGSSGRLDACVVAPAGGGAGDDRLAAREADFDILIERAIMAIREGGNREDPVFGSYAELNSLVRAVTYHEGKLLEHGMARLVADNPSLSLMPPETALPVVPAAVEMLKRND